MDYITNHWQKLFIGTCGVVKKQHKLTFFSLTKFIPLVLSTFPLQLQLQWSLQSNNAFSLQKETDFNSSSLPISSCRAHLLMKWWIWLHKQCCCGSWCCTAVVLKAASSTGSRRSSLPTPSLVAWRQTRACLTRATSTNWRWDPLTFELTGRQVTFSPRRFQSTERLCGTAAAWPKEGLVSWSLRCQWRIWSRTWARG